MQNQQSTTNGSGPKVTIHILRGKAARSSREVKGPSLLIGSHAQCDVQMRSAEVAPRHCLISRRSDSVFVAQLEADHPLMLNGAPVTEAGLNDGDRLQIGPFELGVSIEDTPQRKTGDTVARPAFESIRSSLRTASLPVPPRRGPFSDEPVAKPEPKTPRPEVVRSTSESGSLTSEPPSQARSYPPPTASSSAAADLLAEAAGLSGAPASVVSGELASSKPDTVEARLRSIERELEELPSSSSGIPSSGARESVRRERTVEVDPFDSEKQQLAVLRTQILDEQTSLRHDREAHAQRDRELEATEKSLRTKERDLEHQRVTVTEEMLELDRRRKSLDEQKTRLLRVRRQLFQKYRQRREALADLVDEVKGRAAEIDRRQQGLDEEVTHWTRVGQELGQKRAELERRAAELDHRIEGLDQQRQQLETARVELQQRRENLDIRERSIEKIEADLENRKGDIIALESAAQQSRQRADQEAERARRQQAEFQRRLTEVEGQTHAMEVRERHLTELAHKIEMQRQLQIDRDQELASRAAEIREAESVREATEQHLRQREQTLAIREKAVSEQASYLSRQETELQQLAEECAKERVHLNQRSEELERQSQAILQETEVDRQALEARERELEQEHQRREAERLEFEAEKDKWVVRINEVRQFMQELAQRTSMIEAREKQLDTIEAEHRSQRDEVLNEQQVLKSERATLRQEKSATEELVAKINQQAESLDDESERLQALAKELDARQDEVLKRERSWCEEVKHRRAELKRMSEELERKRVLLERESNAHRRRIKKLQGGRVETTGGQSGTTYEQTREFERRYREFEQQIHQVRSQQQQMLEAVLGTVEKTAQRDQDVSSWISKVRAENRRLLETRQSLGREIQQLLAAFQGQMPATQKSASQTLAQGSAPSNASAEDQARFGAQLEQSLRAWSEGLDRFEELILQREADIADQQQEVHTARTELTGLLSMVEEVSANLPGSELEPVVTSDERAPSPAAGAAESSKPVPAQQAPIPRVDTTAKQTTSHTTQRRVTVRTSATTIEASDAVADSTSLPFTAPAGDSSAQHCEPLAAERSPAPSLTTSAAPASGTPIAAFGSKAATSSLGSAQVLEVIHDGPVETCYLVQLPDHRTPTVLRLLVPQWCRDDTRRQSFVAAVKPFVGHRHPNVVAIHELFSTANRLGVVTDYVDGCSLAELGRYGLPPKAVVSYCCQAVRALEFTQKLGLVHRTLWPGRLLVDRQGGLKIHGYGEPDWLTKIHRCEKTRAFARYVAPEERMVGIRPDVRGDLYSIGQIFRELAAHGAKVDASGRLTLAEAYPQEFAVLLDQLIRENPADRCRSVREILQRLETILTQPCMSGNPWPDLPDVMDEVKANRQASGRQAA